MHCSVNIQVSKLEQLSQYTQFPHCNAEALRTPREHVQARTNTQRFTPSPVIILQSIQRLGEIVWPMGFRTIRPVSGHRFLVVFVNHKANMDYLSKH